MRRRRGEKQEISMQMISVMLTSILATHLIFPPQQPNFQYGNVGVVNTTNVDRLPESLISFNTFLFSGSLINCFQYFKYIEIYLIICIIIKYIFQIFNWKINIYICIYICIYIYWRSIPLHRNSKIFHFIFMVYISRGSLASTWIEENGNFDPIQLYKFNWLTCIM